MATKKLNTRIQNKIDSEANWNNNPDFIPLKGEMIVYSKDANNKAARVKFGDGVTKLSDLKFVGGSSVPPTPIKKPTVIGSLTYNKRSQTPTWLNYDPSKMILSGTTSATDAGTYTATFTPLTGHCWEDDESTDAINVTWTINKANTQIILSSSTVTVYRECELHVKVTVLPEGVGNIYPSYDGTDLSVTTGTDNYGNYGIVIEDTDGSVTDDTKGTITVSLKLSDSAERNYNDSTATINVVAGSVLDGMSWTDIKTLLDSEEDFANYASIGDTKTITLTPNQRIRLPEEEENVKVFVADIYKDSEETTTGALFAGFKDSEGRDIAITPDPKIREKKKLWAGSYKLSDQYSGSVDTIKPLVGRTYELHFKTFNGSSTWSSIRFEEHDLETYVYYGDESDYRWVFETDTGVVKTYPDEVYRNLYVESQYVFAELYEFIIGLTETYHPGDVTFVLKDPPSSPWSLSSSGEKIGYNPVTNEIIHGVSVADIQDQIKLDLGNDKTRLVADNWDRYLTLEAYVYNSDDMKTFFENVEDCDASEVNSCTGWWTFDDTPNIAHLNNDYYGPNSTYDGTPCFRIYGEFEVGSGDTGNELVIIPESEQIILDDNVLCFGTFQNSSYQNICVHSIDVKQINSWLCHEILSEIGQKYEVKGSWIWNPSVSTNLGNLPEGSSGIDIKLYDDASLTQELPDGITWVTPHNGGYDTLICGGDYVVDGNGGFNANYAAMHFGDEPQSVPKFFYDFLVANADYMSYGFGSGLIDKYAGSTLPLSIKLWDTPVSRVLGYTVDDYGYGTYQTATNTLYEALPADFKAVLSNIHEGSSEIGTSLNFIYSLPYLNEIGVSDADNGSGYTDYNSSTRLGYSSWGTDPILYYRNGNTTVKYDIWDKRVPVLQHSSSMGGGTPGFPTYCLIGTSDKTYVKIDDVEELRKHQFVSAGLAPIFLIGSTPEEECDHNWETIYYSIDDDYHYYLDYCENCGEYSGDQKENTTSHNYDSDGVCSDCDHSCSHDSMDLSMLACDEEWSCKHCGVNLGYGENHTYNSETGICEDCFQECSHEYETTHYSDYDDVSHYRYYKCTQCGHTYFNYEQHNWNEKGVCDDCGYVKDE